MTTAASSVIDLQQLRKRCSHCSLVELCLPMGLDYAEVRRLESIVRATPDLKRGDHVYRAGDRFEALYAVRTGCLKTYVVDIQGGEQVLGFHLPGELVGLEAIYPGVHQSSAQALDDTRICRLPYDELAALAGQVPGLQRQLLRLLSRDIGASKVMAGDVVAEARLAGFLLGLSQRLATRGFSSSYLRLTMPRRDIGNYLRMATETVSRLLRRFQDEGLIEVERREVRLLDREGLKAVAGNTAC